MHVVAISGASGIIIGIRLIEELLKADKQIMTVASDSAWQVIRHELFRNKQTPSTLRDIISARGLNFSQDQFKEYKNNDFFSPIASGTTFFDAVIVAPCSMKTLSAIATGYADTLINRAADVALKEKRKCILIPRETPVSLIHLENMTKAKQAGADILLPVPGFYTFPQNIDDVVNFIVGKTLNLLSIKHNLFKNWGDREE